MAIEDSIPGGDDAKAQIAQLRRQVESLMSERVGPVLADAADRAQSAARQASGMARQAGDMARDQAEMISDRVREQPMVAVLIAAGLGYLIGRLAR